MGTHSLFVGAPVNFQLVAFYDKMYMMFLGLTTYLVTLQFLHILRYNKTIAVLGTTIAKSAGSLMGMGSGVLLILIAYSMAGYIKFCPHLSDYSTIKEVMITLTSSFLGNFDFDSIDRVGGTAGRAYLLTYLLVMIFLMINMFITVLCEFMEAIKNDETAVPPDHEVVDFLLNSVKNLVKPEEEEEEEDTKPPSGERQPEVQGGEGRGGEGQCGKDEGGKDEGGEDQGGKGQVGEESNDTNTQDNDVQNKRTKYYYSYNLNS